MTSNLKDIIRDIGRILGELANGNFHVTSNCIQNYIGDYIPILTSMRLIRDNLNATLIQINQSAGQVASGSDQVSSGSQALSQGATEQASSVEELAATINEISDQVKNTAQNAGDAREQTKQAEKETSVCNEQMQEMITLSFPTFVGTLSLRISSSNSNIEQSISVRLWYSQDNGGFHALRLRSVLTVMTYSDYYTGYVI